MKVLIACEMSGAVRDAFRAKGHNAVSIDLLPSQTPGPHIQDDILDFIPRAQKEWAAPPFDMLIAFPPCTYLSVSGLHWNKRNPERAVKTEKALDFVRTLLNAPFERIAIENPVGCISTRIRKPDQIIQPYQFGENASKKTCLWLKGLPKLRPTSFVEPRMVDGKPRWANQTDSGQNKLAPSPDRAMIRSLTYAGIADAMAQQWS